MSVLAVVDCAVNADGPHAGCVPIAITIVLFTAVTGRPYVDVA